MANQYQDNFRCYSSAYFNKPELEETGRILLPETILGIIYQRGIEVPEVMLFSVRNNRLGIVVFAGVESFTTNQGQACIPYWMMDYLQVSEGDPVVISLTTLPTATRALFQPMDSTFFQIPNPKVVLEYTLRRHPCLTQGTMIPINFNKKSYRLKVLKTEPNRAVQIHRADVICDFATPVNEFDHRWNESDTDSSDDEDSLRIKKGKTLSGKVIEEHPKPLHSTFAQREHDRIHGNVFKTTEIVAGQEILPPKPREKAANKKSKKNSFIGNAHFLKNPKKGAKNDDTKTESVQNNSNSNNKDKNNSSTIAKKEEAKKSFFSGTGRSIKADSFPSGGPTQAQRPTSAAAKTSDSGEKKEEPKKYSFSGPGRSIKGDIPLKSTTKPTTTTTTGTPTMKGSDPAEKPSGGSSFFKGSGNKLKGT